MFESLINNIDISEEVLFEVSPKLLETLLIDRTTGNNIMWCTDNYADMGEGFAAKDNILVNQITGENRIVIQPRIKKSLEVQRNRSRDKGEVFTPAWLCNIMNNVVDEEWFGYEDAFSSSEQGSWLSSEEKIRFPHVRKNAEKCWQNYIKNRRMEITCGEAPYLTSRYDMASGEFIPVARRIGLLDRKLRVISENIRNFKEKQDKAKENWLGWAMKAVQSIYGYDWQGDNVLLARENLLLTVIEYYYDKWQEEMSVDWVYKFAEVISWNIWQMDGLKYVVPNSCEKLKMRHVKKELDLFDPKSFKVTAKSQQKHDAYLMSNESDVEEIDCPACTWGTGFNHTGKYCLIKNWTTGKIFKFCDLLITDKGVDVMSEKHFRPDVIIGNPPYQDSISNADGNKSLSKQLFPYFIQEAININPDYICFITPSRWFAGDAQDKSFNKLRDFVREHNHFKKICHFVNGDALFNGVSVGPVNYFIAKRDYNGLVEFSECSSGRKTTATRPLFEDGLDIVIAMNSWIDIIGKVTNHDDFRPFTNITFGRNAFGVVGKKSEIEKVSKEQYFENAVSVRCAYEEIRYMKKSDIVKNADLVDKWKVFTSKGNGGAGMLNEDKAVAILGKVYIGQPGTACTDSLIPIGPLESEIEAKNLKKYMETKFLRFMVGVLKVSQNLYQIVYKYVPIQDFSENSDIEWENSISNIDAQLYAKYKLTETQIEYIEKSIKEMV